jgi:hypothetical protein
MYLASVGWPTTIAFVVSVIIDGAMSNFPRQCYLLSHYACSCNLIMRRDLA